jgi:hypothetical protein
VNVYANDVTFVSLSPLRAASDTEIVLGVQTTVPESVVFGLESSNPGVLAVPPSVTSTKGGSVKARSGVPGTATITLRSPAGLVLKTLDVIVFQKPVATAMAPPAGPLEGGTAVTISGRGFTPGCLVSFGGTAATNVTLAGTGVLTASTPPHQAGPVPVTVTCDGITSTLPHHFIYTLGKGRAARH